MATRVSSTEYRSRLREWHERAGSGEELVITENGRPVVRVVAAGSESVLERLEREGVLRPARPRRPVDQIETVPVTGDSAASISDDRDR